MSKLSKRMCTARAAFDCSRSYELREAIEVLQSLATAKFVESVDVAIQLGIDVRKSDQTVRGATVLPYGTGRHTRVAVFAEGADATAATEAGAELVGLESLVDRIKAGQYDFDVVIATPDTMRVVGQLGQLLGPKGLMPNPKVGTITQDVASAVKKAKAGQVRYRNDKGGVIHVPLGKVSFTPEQLLENLNALVRDLKKLKPSTSKGTYFKSMSLSTTMGPGISIAASYFTSMRG